MRVFKRNAIVRYATFIYEFLWKLCKFEIHQLFLIFSMLKWFETKNFYMIVFTIRNISNQIWFLIKNFGYFKFYFLLLEFVTFRPRLVRPYWFWNRIMSRCLNIYHHFLMTGMSKSYFKFYGYKSSNIWRKEFISLLLSKSKWMKWNHSYFFKISVVGFWLNLVCPITTQKDNMHLNFLYLLLQLFPRIILLIRSVGTHVENNCITIKRKIWLKRIFGKPTCFIYMTISALHWCFRVIT